MQKKVNDFKIGRQKLTPDLAKEVLEECGHIGIVKMLVNHVNEQDKVEYKDFMLSCVCGRQLTYNLIETIEQFAMRHGFEKDFYRVNMLPKVYDVYGKELPSGSGNGDITSF
jgi:predicted enzyme involved in methoxymalonyl-ACP biosynthesis